MDNANGWCPICSEPTAFDASECACCGTDFSEGSKWNVLESPPPPSTFTRTSGILFRVVLGVVSAALLLPGFLFALTNNSTSWTILCLAGLAAVVGVAVAARARWMLLVLIGSAFLSLSSCEHNFHWLGG